jgi:hypothetical protein
MKSQPGIGNISHERSRIDSVSETGLGQVVPTFRLVALAKLSGCIARRERGLTEKVVRSSNNPSEDALPSTQRYRREASSKIVVGCESQRSFNSMQRARRQSASVSVASIKASERSSWLVAR